MPRRKKYSIIKTLPLCLGVLIFTFAISYLVSAWTEPTVSPPGGNVDTPLNVGPAGQYKVGGLILNTGNATTGLIVATGTVGIGTLTPESWAKLDVHGGAEHIFQENLGGLLLGYSNGYSAATIQGRNSVDGNGNLILNNWGGNVGIGTNPEYNLDVSGDLNLRNQVLRLSGATGTAGQALIASADGKLSWVNIKDIVNSYISDYFNGVSFVFTGDNRDCPVGYDALQKYWISKCCTSPYPPYSLCTPSGWYVDPPRMTSTYFSCTADQWSEISCLLSTGNRLIYGIHTADQCKALGGATTTTDVAGKYQCIFSGSACPAGIWTQYKSYSKTLPSTCYRPNGSCYAYPCTTGSHDWGNGGQESCTYGEAPCTHQGGCCTFSCWATITQVGCY